MQIRDADDRDHAGILEIYNDAVLNTTAVWNEAPRTEREHAQWFAAKHAQGHPVLVAIVDDNVAGFCSYGPFRAWSSLPIVPSLELPHLPLGFLPVPAVMLLQSRDENLGAHLDLLDLIVAQTPPSMLDSVL